ncbi:MAG: hypothetical protein BWY86_01092 [Candidatus Aminicenantes bacterium ADurb.Bin508]|nr:MAG: hypothetical protein BWY86_01092 [Candidatus Aminicenantes bacterium ADurb.Bin508]
MAKEGLIAWDIPAEESRVTLLQTPSLSVER